MTHLTVGVEPGGDDHGDVWLRLVWRQLAVGDIDHGHVARIIRINLVRMVWPTLNSLDMLHLLWSRPPCWRPWENSVRGTALLELRQLGEGLPALDQRPVHGAGDLGEVVLADRVEVVEALALEPFARPQLSLGTLSRGTGALLILACPLVSGGLHDVVGRLGALAGDLDVAILTCLVVALCLADHYRTSAR